MRRVSVRVPRDRGREVAAVASELEARQTVVQRGSDAGGNAVDFVTLTIPNVRLGPFLDRLQELPDLHVAFPPGGELTLDPPARRVAQHARDVTPRSPVEILLSGLQSIGSWRAFLAYAVASGVIVWLGLYTETIYLLVAAMLISPFAGPAMNTAIATARGDAALLWRSLVRYVSALCAAAGAAALLSLVMRQELATELMAQITGIPEVAFVLPLAAGAAGALQLCQSERSSLVSAAAVGMLVAASLAPPAGLVGMGVVIGDAGMVGNAIFLLALQLVGINLAGSLVFRIYGMRPDGPRYERGRGWVFTAALGATVAALSGLLVLQLGSREPMLQRGSIEQQARRTTIELLRSDTEVEPVRVVTEFTRPVIAGEHSLLVIAHVRATATEQTSAGVLESRLARAIARGLSERYQLAALVDVALMHREPPPGR